MFFLLATLLLTAAEAKVVVFSGIAGTIGSRKEYTSLGDVVNLSARIMAWPMYKGQKGRIFVEANTKTQASNAYNFYYHGHQEFKGKSISSGVFEPIFNVPGDPLYLLAPAHSPGEPEYVNDKLSMAPEEFKRSTDTYNRWVESVAQKERDPFEPEVTINVHLKVHINPLVMDQGFDPKGSSKPIPVSGLTMIGCD